MEGHSGLRIKGDVTGASVHVTIQRNITYVQTVRRSIYETRQKDHPHSPIRFYKQRPQGHPQFMTPLQNAVYDELGDIIQCQLLITYPVVVPKTDTRKYIQHLCYNFFSVLTLSYLCYERNNSQHPVLENTDNKKLFIRNFDQ